MIEPLVSIIMPTFNREELIGKAISSVMKQNYASWELLIIDNESTDNTREVVEKFSYEDNRIKYFNVEKSKNPGISDYLNFGINNSKAEYLARLDDDDEWFDPNKLKKQIEFLEKNPEYIIVGGGAIMVNDSGKELYRFLKRRNDRKIKNNALYANPFCHNTVLFRKKIAVRLGGYRHLKFVEDWDLWLRMGKEGKFYNFQEYFSLYMNAGQNLSISNQKLAAKTILNLVTTYRHDYPNYYKGYLLNYFQYLFSFAPRFIKNRIQNFLFFIKRNYF